MHAKPVSPLRFRRPTAVEKKPARTASRSAKTARIFLRNRLAKLGAVTVALVAAAAVVGPLMSPYDASSQDLAHLLSPPDRTHPLGTDNLGRDILTRLVYGARYSLGVGTVVIGIGASVGTLIGLLGGYCGGVLDLLTGRLIDTLFAFPGILLAVAIVGAFGPGLTNAMIALGVWSIPTYARIVRGVVLAMREQEFVHAARCLGASDRRILIRHILPNTLAAILVLSSLSMASAILAASGLSFLGLGAQPPTPEWGAMLSDGRNYLRVAPHLSVFPGLAIMLVVLAFNFVGDGLRDALDPKLQ